MAAYAAVTLLKPGTSLDVLWALNRRGHAGLLAMGTGAGLLFVVVSALLALTAAGWFQRRRWGWILAVAIISLNLVGDFANVLIGEAWKGAVGLLIAGMLLIYLMRSQLRSYFLRQ